MEKFSGAGVSKAYKDSTGTHLTDALSRKRHVARRELRGTPWRVAKLLSEKHWTPAATSSPFEKTSGFRLFDNSAPAELQVPKVKVIQCLRCLGFHNERNYTRTERCIKCGKSTVEHKDGSMANCPAPAQCANCYGAHRADSMGCHARPVIRNGERVQPTND